MTTRFLRFVAMAFVGLALTASMAYGQAAAGAIPVYNTSDYLAANGGGVDITAALNFYATQAATSPAHGGIIYMPEGIWQINGAASIPDMNFVTLRGAGTQATHLIIGTSGTLTLSPQSGAGAPFHYGGLENFRLSCNSSTSGVGFTAVDLQGLRVRNISVETCATGIDLQNQTVSSQQDDFDDITFFNCGTAIHFDNQKSGGGNFNYGSYRIWVGTNTTSNIFLATGGATVSLSNFSVQGNIANGSTVFNARSDGHANPMNNNTYVVHVEYNGATANGYIFDNTVDAAPSGSISGVANIEIVDLNNGHIYYANPTSASIAVNNLSAAQSGPVTGGVRPTSGGAATDMGPVAATSGSSQTISNFGITSTSECFVQPIDSNAVNLTQTYITSYATGTATFMHSSGGSGNFELWCHS